MDFSKIQAELHRKKAELAHLKKQVLKVESAKKSQRSHKRKRERITTPSSYDGVSSCDKDHLAFKDIATGTSTQSSFKVEEKITFLSVGDLSVRNDSEVTQESCSTTAQSQRTGMEHSTSDGMEQRSNTSVQRPDIGMEADKSNETQHRMETSPPKTEAEVYSTPVAPSSPVNSQRTFFPHFPNSLTGPTPVDFALPASDYHHLMDTHTPDECTGQDEDKVAHTGQNENIVAHTGQNENIVAHTGQNENIVAHTGQNENKVGQDEDKLAYNSGQDEDKVFPSHQLSSSYVLEHLEGDASVSVQLIQTEALFCQSAEQEKPLKGVAGRNLRVATSQEWLHLAAVLHTGIAVYSLEGLNDVRKCRISMLQDDIVCCLSLCCHGDCAYIAVGGVFSGRWSQRVYGVRHGNWHVIQLPNPTPTDSKSTLPSLSCSWLRPDGAGGTIVVAMTAGLSLNVWLLEEGDSKAPQALAVPSKPPQALAMPSDDCSSVEFSSLEHITDSNWLAAVGGLSLLLWDVVEGVLLKQVSLSCSPAMSMAGSALTPSLLSASLEEGSMYAVLGWERRATDAVLWPPHTPVGNTVAWLLRVDAINCQLLHTYSLPTIMSACDVSSSQCSLQDGLSARLKDGGSLLFWDLLQSTPSIRIKTGLDVVSYHWDAISLTLFAMDKTGTIHLYKET